MGMFDVVKCEYELPWPEANGLEHAWQTKSLGCDLIAYEIGKDGGLRMCMNDDHESELELVDDLDGEVEIHHSIDGQWYSVLFWFRGGFVKDMVCRKSDV